jgi:SAM-dependent methyltransferase
VSPAHHTIAHERELWDTYAGSERVRAEVLEGEPVFRWTQYAGHGPGAELLGRPESVLEIGCGTGRALAWLAEQGVKATGIDLSPVMVGNASRRWGPLGVRFVCAEVLDHLRGPAREAGETYDAVYSVFGAAWFTDPATLFPLVRERLAPGGVFAFSQPPAIPGAYGPQGMYKGGFAGPALYTYRYSHSPSGWARRLRRAGFGDVHVEVLDAPQAGHIGTLIARARRE